MRNKGFLSHLVDPLNVFVGGMVDALEFLRSLVGKLADEPIESDEAAGLGRLAIEVERRAVVRSA